MFGPFDFGAGDGGFPVPDMGQPPLGPLPPMMPQAPLPEQVAGFLGSQNVTPQEFLKNPLAFAPQGQSPSLGSSLEPSPAAPSGGVPLPQPRPAAAGPGASAQAAAPGGDIGSRLQSALKGVQAPKPPDVVKPSTPQAYVPAPHGQVKGGNIAALLAALGSGAPATARVPLPLLGGGRY